MGASPCSAGKFAGTSCCFCQANYSPARASAGRPLSLTPGLEKTCFFLLIFFFKQVNNILVLKSPNRWSRQLIQVRDEGVASLPRGSGVLCVWGGAFRNWVPPSTGLCTEIISCGEPFCSFPPLPGHAGETEQTHTSEQPQSRTPLKPYCLGVGRGTATWPFLIMLGSCGVDCI